MAKSFKSAVREVREYLELNVDADATDEDAVDYLSEECGKDHNGFCSQAGTEYCDFECPFSN
jgi:hypothetical protein